MLLNIKGINIFQLGWLYSLGRGGGGEEQGILGYWVLLASNG